MALAPTTRHRSALERSQVEVSELRERVGRQGAELERATSTVAALDDRLAAAETMLAHQTAEQAKLGRRARTLRIALAVAGTLTGAAMLAPAWVR